ncbi:chorismate--pyruvate lyase family protein [Tolumonas auensis]|uniref:chorismate--pyruvate lyase family protein n=1 Tax=Tolumonas auensis TaxID=43948 RepID=UPI002AA700DA|nr:chorismate lyase [Tolumonas auensis]
MVSQLLKANAGSSGKIAPQQRAPLLHVSSLDDLGWSSASALMLEKKQTDWLLDPGSLTARLQQHTNTLSLQLLTAGWQPKDRDASRLVRQVLLSDGERPWIWGLTQVDACQLQKEPELLNWSTQPLGQLLFAEEQSNVRCFDIADFATSAEFCQMLPRWGCIQTRPLWGRRCELQFRSCRLLLTEVFLPEHPMYGV